MAYCTYNDLLGMIDESEVIQATDDAGTGVVNQEHVTAAINAADSEIDGYLAGRYTLPISPAPAVLLSTGRTGIRTLCPFLSPWPRAMSSWAWMIRTGPAGMTPRNSTALTGSSHVTA